MAAEDLHDEAKGEEDELMGEPAHIESVADAPDAAEAFGRWLMGEVGVPKLFGPLVRTSRMSGRFALQLGSLAARSTMVDRAEINRLKALASSAEVVVPRLVEAIRATLRKMEDGFRMISLAALKVMTKVIVGPYVSEGMLPAKARHDARRLRELESQGEKIDEAGALELEDLRKSAPEFPADVRRAWSELWPENVLPMISTASLEIDVGSSGFDDSTKLWTHPELR